MLSVAEALARVLSHFQPLEKETVPCESAVGRVLAESVRATLDLPPFPNSSMDGYAVRAADVRLATQDSPVMLAVVGDIPAGRLPTLQVEPGAAARIMTGAPMPAGADAVVPVEATGLSRTGMDTPLPRNVQVHQSVPAGAYVRPAGEDVRAGEVVLVAGKVVRAYEVGVLAAFGLAQLDVIRRPRVAILSTGDELVAIDQSPGPGQIRDSNTYSLAALTQRAGGEPLVLGVADDSVEAVTDKLQTAVTQRADVILSSAGVSVGAYDVVKAAVEQSGSLDFWKVRMRPGKPVAFGRYAGIPFFGLPGNPVSAIVAFEVFVRPALLKLGGRTQLAKPVVDVALAETFNSDGRESYLRATVTKEDGRYVAHSSGGQGSNILSALIQANALVIIPEGITEIGSGATVKAWMLDWPEEVF
ncbi:MAG TPA: gephyrin-like molybdotransferase Glp [Anaerolineales bacterium]|nr:gephyrin-like molybdotransferase Glp [Anaerolineales bacterium]